MFLFSSGPSCWGTLALLRTRELPVCPRFSPSDPFLFQKNHSGQAVPFSIKIFSPPGESEAVGDGSFSRGSGALLKEPVPSDAEEMGRPLFRKYAKGGPPAPD